MDYKILSNIRLTSNNFNMLHDCSFCDKFNSKVLKIPDTSSLICHSCLRKMMKALEKAMMEEILIQYME